MIYITILSFRIIMKKKIHLLIQKIQTTISKFCLEYLVFFFGCHGWPLYQLMDISHHNGRNSDIIFILMSNKMTQTFCLSQQTEQRLVCSSGSILVFWHLGVHIRQLFAHRLVIVYRLNDSQGNESLLSCHSCDSFLNLISHLGHGVLTELTEMSLNFISGQIKVSYLFTHFNSCWENLM